MHTSSDIYTKLKDDHAVVAKVLQRLAQADASDPTTREALFTELKLNLQQHSEVENRVFYSKLLRYDATRSLIRDGQQEHERIEDQLDELEQTDKESPQWGMRLQALQETIEHHVREEEHKLFAKAKTILTRQQAEEMGQQFAQAQAGETVSQVKNTAARHAPETTAKAQEAGTQVYEEARRLAGEAKQQGQTVLRQQQNLVASQIESLAGALHKTAEQLGGDEQGALAQYTEQAAAGLERVSHGIRDQDFNTLVRQVESFARQQPAVFIGSAALVGFLAARFLKSSAERSTTSERHTSYTDQGMTHAYASPATSGSGDGSTAAAGSSETQPSTRPSPVPDARLEATGGSARRITTIPGGE